MGNFKELAEIGSYISICVGVGVAMWQLISYKIEHKQRKKQATIEFYQNIRKEFVGLLDKVSAIYPNQEIVRINDVQNNEDMLSVIREYLCHMEKFSVGVNGKIYDFATFEAMSGISAMGWFDKLEEVIGHFRRGNPDVFKNFENLVIKLKKTKSQNKEN